MAHSSDTVTGRRVIQSRTVDRSAVFTARPSVQRDGRTVHAESARCGPASAQTRRSRGPHPLTDFWQVLEVGPTVRLVLLQHRPAFLDQCRRALVHPLSAPEGLHREVIAAYAVPHDHVEGRRGGPLLDVPTHVEPLGLGTPV